MQRAGCTLIHVRGELDADTIHVLLEALHASDGAVVIDLHHVTFADSALVHALLDALPDRELALTGPLAPQVGRLLDATGTRSCFPMTVTLHGSVQFAGRARRAP
ncbi:STAS domain-containing protein [Streptomyces sp. NPDC004311]|uniref:STAS domain-containing protein n=1 Tax=Streptomyces sp. NPDC004311 TaxID=3364698 RepID=UPI003687DE00